MDRVCALQTKPLGHGLLWIRVSDDEEYQALGIRCQGEPGHGFELRGHALELGIIMGKIDVIEDR